MDSMLLSFIVVYCRLCVNVICLQLVYVVPFAIPTASLRSIHCAELVHGGGVVGDSCTAAAAGDRVCVVVLLQG